MRRWTIALFLGLFALPAVVSAQPAAGGAASVQSDIERLRRELDEQRKTYDEKLKGLDEKIASLSRDSAAAPAKGVASGLKSAAHSLGAEVGVVGDFLARYDTRGGKADPGLLLQVREVEIDVSGQIDSYARGNLYIGFESEESGHTHVHVEEAYATFPELLWELQVRAGRFRADFGKVNTVHRHALPWVEYPLVNRRFFGDEGLRADGLAVSRMVTAPWDGHVELTYEIFRNDNETLFAGHHAQDVAQLIHLKNFFDLTPRSSLEIGLSAMTAPNNAHHGGQRTSVGGADLTFTWRPSDAGSHQKVTVQAEALMCRKDLDNEAVRHDAWGMFGGVEYQFAERWALGGRYDFSEDPDVAGNREHAGSLYLTFRQSAACFWRIGYQQSWRNFEDKGAKTNGVAWLQFNFAFGGHGGHSH